MNHYEESTHRPVIVVGEQETESRKKNSNAPANSMALGILSLIFCWIPVFSFVMAVIGLILGIVSFAGQRDGYNMALVGVITSTVGILLSVIAGVLWIMLLLW